MEKKPDEIIEVDHGGCFGPCPPAVTRQPGDRLRYGGVVYRVVRSLPARYCSLVVLESDPTGKTHILDEGSWPNWCVKTEVELL